jgi:predicted DNA-binding transcriptional regulator YafY
MGQLRQELRVSRATVGRDIKNLREIAGLVVQWDATQHGYRVITKDGEAESELLGLRFAPSELHALLAMDQLLRRIQPGSLSSRIAPLRDRIKKILGAEAHSLSEIERRVRVLPMSARPVDARIFDSVLTGLLNRKRLYIEYLSRRDASDSKRVVSPQRLVHYRDNWYLDAWCHRKRGLRMFTVDAIRAANVLAEPARDMPEEYLAAVLESGYGIFSGRRTRLARIRFSPLQSRFVSTEIWHPKQEGALDKRGCYVLKFPYSNDPELIMDLLRHIPEVEVLGPKSLRNHLNMRVKTAARRIA